MQPVVQILMHRPAALFTGALPEPAAPKQIDNLLATQVQCPNEIPISAFDWPDHGRAALIVPMDRQARSGSTMEESANGRHAASSLEAPRASRALVRFSMSVSVPSVRFRRYMPGNRASGTIDT